jgi:hypothetical protein
MQRADVAWLDRLRVLQRNRIGESIGTFVGAEVADQDRLAPENRYSPTTRGMEQRSGDRGRYRLLDDRPGCAQRILVARGEI